MSSPPYQPGPASYLLHGIHCSWAQVHTFNVLRTTRMDAAHLHTSDPDALVAEWFAATAAALAAVNPSPPR